MITPQLFYAGCVVVVVLFAWLFWAMRSYKTAAASFQKACRIHKDRADAIDADRRSVADELVKEQSAKEEAVEQATQMQTECGKLKTELDTAEKQLAAAKGQLLDLQRQFEELTVENGRINNQVDKLAADNEALLKQIDAAEEAYASRPVLAVATKASQRGRHRVQLKDTDGKVLLQSPAGFGSTDKTDAIIERLCGSRLEKAE